MALVHKSETVTFYMYTAAGITLEAAVGVSRAITSVPLHLIPEGWKRATVETLPLAMDPSTPNVHKQGLAASFQPLKTHNLL